MKYGNRSPGRKFLNSPFTLIGLVILVVILTKAAWGIHTKVDISQNKLNNAQVELERLKSRQNNLATEINKLSTDQGIESELRTKYRAVREGESVAVIVDDKASTTELAPKMVLATTTANIGWWRRMLHAVGL